MLRSWFLLAFASSSFCVRMCQGAPLISPAPSGSLPSLQKLDCARWPPHASRTADPVALKVTTMSADTLPSVSPLYVGAEMLVIVPPYIVRKRFPATPNSAAASASFTSRLFASGTWNVRLVVNCFVFAAPRLGQRLETPPPPV